MVTHYDVDLPSTRFRLVVDQIISRAEMWLEERAAEAVNNYENAFIAAYAWHFPSGRQDTLLICRCIWVRYV
jgi:hypothetical protein